MSKRQKTVLIIKIGYCETLANEIGFIPSLGDVFRHTVLLRHYQNCKVTWMTSESAFPLLKGNPFIHELLGYGEATLLRLAKRSFDEVLCFEKAPSLCNFAKSIKADRYFGFGWNGTSNHAHPMAQEALDIANGKKRQSVLQDVLYQMIGAKWQGEDYILGYNPTTVPVTDVGLNYLVGQKWPSKAWSMTNWKRLEAICRAQGYSVSWQRGASNLYEYMDWVNSVRTLVTCDSLGMHLGIALKKSVVALFGPTSSREIHLYGRGSIIRPVLDCPRSPCMQPVCDQPRYCMDYILPGAVFKEMRRFLKPSVKFENRVIRRQPVRAPNAVVGVV